MVIFAVLLLCAALLVSCTLSSQAAEPQSETITIPTVQFNELRSNNNELLTLTKTSSNQLTTANSLIQRQSTELTEVKSLLNKQATELTKASKDLNEQSNLLNETNKSLTILKDEIKRNKATEQRLHRQRNTWAVVAGIILTYSAIK